MLDYNVLYGFLVSFGIGTLIGIERESQKRKNGELLVAGIRTFILTAMLGTTTALISEHYPTYMPAALAMGLVVLVVIGYYRTSADGVSIGMTTGISQIFVFSLGYLSLSNETREISIMLGIIVTSILALKEHTHELAMDIEKYELLDTLKFAAVAFIILPILPDTTIDPWNIINPHQIWLLVVLISGISYVGYILVKILGMDKGIGLTGLLGGISSSTAVTTAMAVESRRKKSISRPTAFAAVLASSVMFPRMILEAFVVDPALSFLLLIPLTAMFLTGAVSSIAILKRQKGDISPDLKLKTPFALKPALNFAFFFLIIVVLQYSAKTYLGESGIYVISILSGFVDVNAITLSSAKMASQGEIAYNTAMIAITLAAIANTIMKSIYAYIMGNKEFAKLVGLSSAATMLAGGIAVFLI